ncbi:carboxylating nicotinate-nucleotide diphosphorylase [Croceimicrobium hydrocarbonivorans]|uniref:Probable nicotinate-nucleotide pyrophosphorylase [carboxylating] n=1 Tax=Croceimicrobium hydrocarbonivorans TaxID=2761580 RepID=A0A7H0VGC3_9FLAO|nr:carboxylating nicotinate-nucleotide diphosphorylase [Croceimicrobium hydrocarbonivorans]QNR24771.1 carboxylating nicotinate-nucleotide diphosphorylase [Croceimicrobium hydrocarbonivorans]
MDSEKYHSLIKAALAEDIGDGDHSSNCAFPQGMQGRMKLLVKEEGVLAGVAVAREVFKIVDPQIKMEVLIEDGSRIKPGDLAFHLEGPAHSLLQAERLALNLMQRMSGIATKTRALVDTISHTQARLLDTRKTTPHLRVFEKEAVRWGGGYNHRFGLFDMIMLKDNHIDFAGGVPQAIQKALDYKAKHGLDIPIEVEVRDFKELDQVLESEGVLRVMFDNFSVEDTYRAVELVASKIETESSGGITGETLVAYAETGVDFISMGALTHSVSGLDMSLKAELA